MAGNLADGLCHSVNLIWFFIVLIFTVAVCGREKIVGKNIKLVV